MLAGPLSGRTIVGMSLLLVLVNVSTIFLFQWSWEKICQNYYDFFYQLGRQCLATFFSNLLTLVLLGRLATRP